MYESKLNRIIGWVDDLSLVLGGFGSGGYGTMGYISYFPACCLVKEK